MKYLKPIPGHAGGCVNCGGSHAKLDLKTPIMAGFGTAEITRNEKTIYFEIPNITRVPRLARFERMARLDLVEADWRYKLSLPLRDAEYQRQGKNNWVLIKAGLGFA